MCRRLHAERGFTLIELLMVVAILVLAAMAMARLDRARVASNEASAISSPV
jgi:prepilin-type N-terminal cleavage/methylation domain-containing protein